MDVKISRRELALAVTSAAALAGQTQSAPPAQSPQDELAAARQQNTANQEALAKFEIPQATEPAVHFRA
jgi:hypothetical protein